MSTESVSLNLDTLWADYSHKVSVVAKEVRDRYIVPLCKKRGWHFRSGMGEWWIGPTRGDYWGPEEHLEDAEWQEIVDILTLSVEGMWGDLGSLMPEFNPEDTDV